MTYAVPDVEKVVAVAEGLGIHLGADEAALYRKYLLDQLGALDTFVQSRIEEPAPPMCSATRQPAGQPTAAEDPHLVLTPTHDGRLIADVVAEWARRHGQPFTLILTGAAGGQWRSGTRGEHFELDALEFGWALAGRARAAGLFTTRVPF